VLAVAVKPQDAAALLAELGPHIPKEKLVISLCAGLPTSFFTKWLSEGTPIIRVMTNTPALVDEAMTAISAGPHATAHHLAVAEELFTPLGRTIRVPESQQDAVTALSGSGPAYFYCLVEAMTDAGILLGLPRQVAHDLIVQTAIATTSAARTASALSSTLMPYRLRSCSARSGRRAVATSWSTGHPAFTSPDSSTSPIFPAPITATVYIPAPSRSESGLIMRLWT
jgi:pyrroline-5-carboxylate reductase